MGKGARIKRERAEKRDFTIRMAATQPAEVMAFCTTKDKYFPTGVVCDPSSFVQATFADNRSQCPHCGQMHRWGDAEIALAN